MRDTTHNPFNETHWVSCLRENLTSSSYGEGLETDRAVTQVPRQSFTRQIAIRDARALYGLAQDQCRKLTHIIGANTFRLLMAAARTLWFIAQSERQGAVELRRYRPWYWQKVAPSQLDVTWACREALGEAGIFPIPRFFTDLGKNQHDPDIPLPSAA